jgi:hypothetical protein
MIYSNSDILTTTIGSSSGAGKQYYKAKKFPPIPPTESDVYVITTEGDRLDLLAFTYYDDASLWWVISGINNGITFGSMFPEPGTQLRIPININEVLNIFNNAN